MPPPFKQTTRDELAAAEPMRDDSPVTRGGAFGARLTPEKLAQLRPHLVNLNLGRFSSDGEWKTSPADVDAIFDDHLERALVDAEASQEPLRILFFAHGGLVKESAGLAIAHKHFKFFRDNGIFPISFVWETGLFETIGQLLRRTQDVRRGFVDERVTDPAIEVLARRLAGPRIWAGMKFSAECAVADRNSIHGQGGAHYVAERLAEFCTRHAAAPIELHAVAHSAGAVFHSHFLATANSLGVPSFKSAHFLAPAVRVDTFKALLGDRIGHGKAVDHLSLFTMSQDYERRDHCALIYRKSLLYLIHHALEPERETPILGLEESLRADPELAALFGLDGSASVAGDVIFARTLALSGRSASTATTHSAFDDDAPTLGSVVRRILGKSDEEPIVDYVPEPRTRGQSVWDEDPISGTM